MASKRVFGTLDPFLEAGPVLGRRVANVHFLRFLLAADPCDEYHFFLVDRGEAKEFPARLERLVPGFPAGDRIRVFDRRELPAALRVTPFHVFHLSDCIVSPAHVARLRNLHAPRLFPVTGVTHSLSYADYAAPFLRHLWAGATGRDCIVATSSPGLAAVRALLNHLRAGFGLSEREVPGPRLALIPLGVDAEEFAPDGQPAADGPCRLLVFGRIAHASKMDLLPLLRALQRLFAEGLPREAARLTLAGWVDKDDPFPETLKELAANIGLDLSVAARPSEAEKVRLFRESDVFVSVADNPQETFGITLLEAGAAGLPVVASDYDGYRDIVRHGETGLLVPTLGPAATDELDALAAILPDNQYHLLLAQRTAVEVPALAAALRRLIESPQLRRDLGRAGRERVRAFFAWPEVIRRWIGLWDELWAAPADDTVRARAHPLHLPYGRMFAGYPTRSLDPATRLVAGRTGLAVYRGLEHPVLYAGLRELIDPEAVGRLAFLARKPAPAGELAARLRELFPGLGGEAAEFHLLWALKQDILERADED